MYCERCKTSWDDYKFIGHVCSGLPIELSQSEKFLAIKRKTYEIYRLSEDVLKMLSELEGRGR